MTDHPPTFTAAELAKLGDTLDSLSALICTADDWCEPTALGLLIEHDDDALRAAAKVVRRLALDLRFSRRNSPAAYLPAPALAAVPETCQQCGIAITISGHPRYCASCDDVLNAWHRVQS